MSRAVEALKLAYRGVLIERPCHWCDLTSYHYDGKCQDGPCSVCGVQRRVGGWASHPLEADGQWRSMPAGESHDWQPHAYAPAEITPGLPAFEAIVDVAAELGMPERYTSDLFRDYQQILQSPEQCFVWVVRQWGTHYIAPQTCGAVRWLQRNEPTARAFWWDGSELSEVAWDEASRKLGCG